MIKRLAIFLCIVLLVTGCSNNNIVLDNEETPEPTDQEQNIPSVPVVNQLKFAWQDPLDNSSDSVDFSPTSYSIEVPDYKVAANLENIENISRFSGFSEEQISKLANNGFVVLDPNRDRANSYMKMYDIYEENEYSNIPSFITVDVSLHLYHKFFDETLKALERDNLVAALQQLTQSMLQKTVKLYSDEANHPIKDELANIISYFSVANKLINDTYGDIPKECIIIAEKEMAEIERTAGYVQSPLFGTDLNYEQFIPRGHYAGDKILEKYFKTMMWYGLAGFRFKDKDGNYDYESIIRSMLITSISFLDMDGADDITLWDKIYSPTDLFVGQSDDITLFDLKDVILKVYGNDFILNDFKDDIYYPKLIEEIEKLPEPQIQNKIVTGAVDTPTDKQFRFMGQRYTLDANILQELMFPMVRPIPTGLDVVSALGSKRAEAIVEDEYLMELKPDDYTTALQPLKDKVNGLSQSDWQQNLYNGWLWVLKEVWSEPEAVKGMPFFMQNKAWYDKNIQTGLGSYAELKHDTVLYAKQPVAEMGGGEEVQVYYPNYVEPAVEVYDRLLWLIRYSRVNLEKRGLLSDSSRNALTRMEEMYELFRGCSVKELESIALTEEENRALKYIGGVMEGIDDSLADQYKQIISSAIVSDVAGFADSGTFLELGSGLPNEIYVALNYEDRVYLARGVVYSYYEFISEKPLTDQEWHNQLGVEKIDQDGWIYESINAERLLKDAPAQPNWMKTFKSFEENRVSIKPVEYQVED